MYAEEIMKRHPEINFGVYLEGEESMPELLDNLDEPWVVRGLFYRRNGQVHFTGVRQPLDFDALPEPRRDFVDIKKYMGNHGAIGVETKRGCVMECSYCTYPFLSGGILRIRFPKKVVDEIEHLIKAYGVEEIMFIDPVFNIPPEHAKEICREIIRRKVSIRWSAWCNPKYVDEEYMRLAMKAGCFSFFYSPDGFSDRTLDLLNKNMTQEDIIKTYSLTKRLKEARVAYNFFANPPGQNIGTLIRLLIFFLKTKIFLRSRLLGFGLGYPRIEPYTPLYEMALRQGFLNKDTNLLPANKEGLADLFYRPPHSKHIDIIVSLLYMVKRTMSKLIKRISRSY